MVLGSYVEPNRPTDGTDAKVASSGVQTVALFEAAPQGTTVYKVQVDSFEDIPGSEPVGLKLVGPDEHLFRLSNNTVEVRTVLNVCSYIVYYPVHWTSQIRILHCPHSSNGFLE